jgi:hypothetical protein
MIFVPTVINNTTPALSVQVADTGDPAVTYPQIKQSFGSYVYNIESLYIYTPNINQIIGVIQYQRFDATGQQEVFNIPTTLDPYQLENAINVDLTTSDTMFILNGNSSFSTTILPNTYIQIKIRTKRITNSFGRNLDAFKEMERIFRKPNFFDNYGDVKLIQETNKGIRENISTKTTHEKIDTENLEDVEINLNNFTGKLTDNTKDVIVFSLLSLGIICVGIYFYKRKK